MKKSLKDQIKYVYDNAEKGKQIKLCNDYTIRASSFSKNELSEYFLLSEDFISLHLVKTPIKNKKIANTIEVMIENFRNETNSYNSTFDDGDELYLYSAPRISTQGRIKESVVYGVGFVHFSGKNCEGAWLHPFFRGKGLIKGFFLQYALNKGFFKPVPPFSYAITRVLCSVVKEINSQKDKFPLYISEMKKTFYEELFEGCKKFDIPYEEITKIKFKDKEMESILAFANISDEAILPHLKEKLGTKKQKEMYRFFIVRGSAMMRIYIEEKGRVETDKDVIEFQKFMKETEILREKRVAKEKIKALGAASSKQI